MNDSFALDHPFCRLLLYLSSLTLVCSLFGGCIRYSVIEPVPHLAVSVQSANAVSAHIVAVVDQVAAQHGFDRLGSSYNKGHNSNLLAYYSNYRRIHESQLQGNPYAADYEARNQTTYMTIRTGNIREVSFDLSVSPGDPRSIATVVIAGEIDWDVLLTASRIVKDLRAQIKEVQFKTRTTSKYSG